MIAMAIVAGLLLTLLYTLNRHVDIASRHESLTVSAMLAREKLKELQYGRTAAPGESAGNFDAPYENYRFEITRSDSPRPGVAQISVTVTDDTSGTTLIGHALLKAGAR